MTGPLEGSKIDQPFQFQGLPPLRKPRMNSRVSRPAVELIEDRVLTTAIGSHAGAAPALIAGAPRVEVSWAAITLTNLTSHTVVYQITMRHPDAAPTILDRRLGPNMSHGFRHPFRTGGLLPTFTVTFETAPRKTATQSLYPSVFSTEPSEPTIIQNAFKYKFRVNGTGHVTLGSV